MDSVKKHRIASLSRLFRTLNRFLQLHAETVVAPLGRIPKIKSSREIVKGDQFKDEIRSTSCFRKEEEEEEELSREALQLEALTAKLLASISCIKAAYAQLQFSQSPYDSNGIQKSDHLIVLELKKLSELKQGYMNEEFDDSPGTSIMGAEIQELRSLLKIYEITRKKVEHQLNLKLSKVTLLKEKLEEIHQQDGLLAKRLNQAGSGPLSNPQSLQPTDLYTIEHFITVFGSVIKSMRNFVRMVIYEMKSANWDVNAAASAIEPDVFYSEADHKCFIFESYVSREMFDAFQFPEFSMHDSSLPEKRILRELFLDRFAKLRSADPRNFLHREPKSEFAIFCRLKYLRLIHPRMESAFFGDLSQRNTVNSGGFPDSEFFALFAKMAKWVWLLHCMALSFDPPVSIFQASRGSRFSEVYMENVVDHGLVLVPDSPDNGAPSVAFTVVPGLKIGKTIVQCQVYLLDQKFNQG